MFEPSSQIITDNPSKKTESSFLQTPAHNKIINPETLDAINIFFKLKHKYENDIQKTKNKIIGRDDLNIVEKRDLYQTLNPKCIICKKPGGCIFSIEKNRYVAMCNATPKCNFNINITKGNIILLDNYVKELQVQHTELVTTIMKTKYNLLFNYLNETDTVTAFKKTKETFDSNATALNVYKTKLVNISHLLEKKEAIDLSETQIVEFIKEIKQLVSSAKTEMNPQYLKDAVELYIHRLMGVLDTNREYKYSYQGIELDDNGNHNLVQKGVTICDLEAVLGEPYKVVSLAIKK